MTGQVCGSFSLETGSFSLKTDVNKDIVTDKNKKPKNDGSVKLDAGVTKKPAFLLPSDGARILKLEDIEPFSLNCDVSDVLIRDISHLPEDVFYTPWEPVEFMPGQLQRIQRRLVRKDPIVAGSCEPRSVVRDRHLQYLKMEQDRLDERNRKSGAACLAHAQRPARVRKIGDTFIFE